MSPNNNNKIGQGDVKKNTSYHDYFSRLFIAVAGPCWTG